MFVRTFDKGESFFCAGNEYLMLLPRDVTDCCEMVMEKIEVGGKTPPNAHTTFSQVFIVLRGEVEITIGGETRTVSAPAVAYIPKNTNHSVRNAGVTEVKYVYISVWSNGIPIKEKEGGWRKASADMVQEYAERGYPPKTQEG